jgi:hypothetical protein
VTAESPAAKAGFKAGDVVTSVGSGNVTSPKDLSRLVADLSPGDKQTVTVWRGGKSVELKVAIGGNDDGQQLASAKGDDKQARAGRRSASGLPTSRLTSANSLAFRRRSKVPWSPMSRLTSQPPRPACRPETSSCR